MMDFSGKTVIVTGGTKGIGAACVRLFHARGANVVVVYRGDADAAEALVGELGAVGCPDGGSGGLGGCAVPVCADVSNTQDIERLMALVEERFGGLDILVNNAGIMQSTDIEDMTEDEWDHVLAVNLKSVFFMTQKALPMLKACGSGKVVNVTSLAGRNGGFVNGLAYTASKAGIVGLTKGFASRLAPFGICVNAVAPGTTETGILKGVSDEKMAGLLEKIPVGRLGKPEESAAAVAFLCSDEAGFVTGAVLDVNGGMYFA
ncbi:MAG: 3-oxoacyl-ACP reductase FabG [Clostridiales bacterium]|nr:3-oxoacyl-ACP reductase FabG [Clostridiales bacterium]